MSQSKRIGVYVFPGSEELDWAGPWEVLAAWSQVWPEDGIEVMTVGRNVEPVTCAKGLQVIPARSWADTGALDVLVVPGGRGVRALLEDEAALSRLRETALGGTLMASVCTGSWLLAKIGLLDGKPATSHWSGLERLAELGKDIEVRANDRYVDTGQVLTAAGVSAGIDLALHLVARLGSVERAREVRRYIQYDPAPPV
jgi:transcriptional regulator GlxA family with amidase domain